MTFHFKLCAFHSNESLGDALDSD